MADYITQIEAEIAAKRADITKLEIALEVVKRLAKKADKPEKQKPLFTVRKVVGDGAGAALKRHDDLPSAAESRQTVLDLLAQGPMTSGDINDRLGYGVKYQKQRVYSTLNGFMQAGIVERDENGVHRLTAQPSSAEQPDEVEQPQATTSQAA